MHSLNIDVARKHSLLEIGPPTGGGTSTPYSLNTPDILNTLMNITANPFFEVEPSGSDTGSSDPAAGGEEDRKVFATLETPSAAGSSPKTPTQPPPFILSPSQPSSVQSLRSQFIKDSLKLTIQTKRKTSGKTELDLSAEIGPKIRRREELTPEDEERRKRRRERNKVAATKCRNKKKEKTGLLVLESETLVTNNISLKSQIAKLEEERIRLMESLANHSPSCQIKQPNQHSVIVTNNNSNSNGMVQSYGGEYNVIHGPVPNNHAYYRQHQAHQQIIQL